MQGAKVTPLVVKGPLQVKLSDSGRCPSSMCRRNVSNSKEKQKQGAIPFSAPLHGCTVPNDTTNEK